jgi:hypothetical protein
MTDGLEQTLVTKVDGRTLATAWMSVALASGREPDRPQLFKTVRVEVYPSGLRLIATDSYMLLYCWVPASGEPDEEPELHHEPIDAVTVIDTMGRAASLMTYVLAATKPTKDVVPPSIDMLAALTIMPNGDQAGFDGMEAAALSFEIPDHESLLLPTYEGDWPHYAKLFEPFTPKNTKVIGLNPEVIGRLAKLGKYHENRPIRWEMSGSEHMTRVSVTESNPDVIGAVMPVRWFDPVQVKKSKAEEDEEG